MTLSLRDIEIGTLIGKMTVTGMTTKEMIVQGTEMTNTQEIEERMSQDITRGLRSLELPTTGEIGPPQSKAGALLRKKGQGQETANSIPMKKKKNQSKLQ